MRVDRRDRSVDEGQREAAAGRKTIARTENTAPDRPELTARLAQPDRRRAVTTLTAIIGTTSRSTASARSCWR
jgi:hypothetical protein